MDVTALDLAPREAFVLSRVDGATSVAVLADIVGLGAAELSALLERLVSLGAICWEGTSRQLDQVAADEAELRSGRAQVDPAVQALLEEPGDLSRAERLRILAALRDVETRTYWEILGLFGEPSAADIKRAYFEASKQFHPDRFFGRELGSLAPRLDKLFRGIKLAHDVLGDAAAREAYSAQHPPPAQPRRSLADAVGRPSLRAKSSPAPAVFAVSAAEQEQKRLRLEARRQEIALERKRRQSGPSADAAKKARELYEIGLEQMRRHDLLGAAASFKLAVAYAPTEAEYASRYAEVNEAAIERRCVELTEAADVEAATGRYSSAAKKYARASELRPAQGNYALRAAELFAHAGDNAAAVEQAQRGVKALPRKKEARLLAANLLEQSGQLEAAAAQLEAAAALDRDDPHVKKALKELTRRLRRS